ncbi:hypothetical protein PR003_g30997 [Phytophthora rubi]|uniref:Uncharacterized protein n=1 Tax=Phytophthora rubi TaxID=129364 RepID=A0A6A4B8P6_9STRA|nr:hypothetical protein PR001_g31189 [Phytophthora rubi]KAE9269924.1 hypothetical protein PR003_g30997 [Phytophthora rubi]
MEVNVAFNMMADMAEPYNSYVTDLQNDDLRVLIYAGDADLMCNWNDARGEALALLAQAVPGQVLGRGQRGLRLVLRVGEALQH